MKRAFVLRSFPERLSSDLSRKIKIHFHWIGKLEKFVFSEVPSFYFRWKPPFARRTFLQKRLWKYRCYKWTVCSMLFTANIALDQEVIVADIVLELFIFTCLWCTPTHTFNRSRVATKDVVETETSSKNPKLETCVSRSIPRLENLWIMPFFLKNIITTSKLNFFWISGIFPTCFDHFSPANTVDKRHVELQKFCYAISLQY